MFKWVQADRYDEDELRDATCRTVYEAESTIRGQYGITDTRNCGHGSGEGVLLDGFNHFLRQTRFIADGRKRDQIFLSRIRSQIDIELRKDSTQSLDIRSGYS